MGARARTVSSTRFRNTKDGLWSVVALHAPATLFEDLCLSEAHSLGVVGAGRRETQEFVSTDLLAVKDLEDRSSEML